MNGDDVSVCKEINKECSLDRDCCSSRCGRSFNLFTKHCKDPVTIMSKIKNIISPKGKYRMALTKIYDLECVIIHPNIIIILNPNICTSSLNQLIFYLTKSIFTN